jgi:type IV secretion system protein TrbF
MSKLIFKKNKNPTNESRQKMTDAFPSRKDAYKNPWQHARRLFDAQNGELLVRAYNWRKVALIASLTALLSVFGLVYVSIQKKYVPYVVEVDKLGNAVTAQFLSPNSPSDERVIKAYLGRFVNNWRSVTFDPGLERKSISDLYSMLATGTPAVTKISDYFRKSSPIDRAKKETVVITITSVLPISSHIWQVEWTEASNNLQGSAQSITRWIATLNIEMNPPQEEEEILKNPLGMFITDLNWAQQL